MRRLLRSPLLHFVLLGVLLYVGQVVLRTSGPTYDPEAFQISVAVDRLAELTKQFSETTGRGPTPSETERMVDAEVDEEEEPLHRQREFSLCKEAKVAQDQ